MKIFKKGFFFFRSKFLHFLKKLYYVFIISVTVKSFFYKIWWNYHEKKYFLLTLKEFAEEHNWKQEVVSHWGMGDLWVAKS